ncbi:hypothetical protein AXG93_2931s1400 [Marchantia polymorpha subsp. ruderalis]|uniref:Uncharacterized protein n=1 Tax=Marchantia polymorpha subsp. ruderalis TaxID=1480154 RepID=A0A176VVW1_MARPO|nr:hypothetical protein AXG93_2931s1400 [Marchantia polymorpha subsp. ruderalis]
MAGLGASTSTSYEGEDFSYLASAAQVEASVAVVGSGARTSEPRGATVELDPQRGEGGRQSRLPQSFLLSEVGSSSSMRPAPPSDTRVRTEVLTSSVVDADVPSSAVMRMATSVLRSPLFSATELIDSGIDLARVFRVAATSCERGRVAATSAEIREDTVEDPSSTSTLFEETTWQAAAARMESLPARPAIDRESIVPGVCMVDNRSGLFRLVSSTGQVYVPARVLLDSGAQPLMLGKAACISLGIRSVVGCYEGWITDSSCVFMVSLGRLYLRWLVIQHHMHIVMVDLYYYESTVHQLVEPNADERERAMGFMTGATAAASVSEASRRQVLGQAMDLNCLTWIVSLDLAKNIICALI